MKILNRAKDNTEQFHERKPPVLNKGDKPWRCHILTFRTFLLILRWNLFSCSLNPLLLVLFSGVAENKFASSSVWHPFKYLIKAIISLLNLLFTRLNIPSQEIEGCSSSGYRRTKDNETDMMHRKPIDDFNLFKAVTPCNAIPPLHCAILTGCHHIIPDLLKCGAEINGRGHFGETALHLACELLNQEAIELLLHCGANINLTTLETKKTPLHIAVWSSPWKAGIILGAISRCVELLLFNGANVHMKDSKGQEAIHYACQNGRDNIIMLLYNYGADMNSLTEQEESPLFFFFEKVSNLRKVNVLKKLLSLSYPLKLINREGRLPKALSHPRCKRLKNMLRREALEVWSLQDICKFNVRNIYRGTTKYSLIETIPTQLWNSIFIYEEYSYASRIKDYFA